MVMDSREMGDFVKMLYDHAGIREVWLIMEVHLPWHRNRRARWCSTEVDLRFSSNCHRHCAWTRERLWRRSAR